MSGVRAEVISFCYVVWAKALARQIELAQSHIDTTKDDDKWLLTRKSWTLCINRISAELKKFHKELATSINSALDTVVKNAKSAIEKDPIGSMAVILTKSQQEASDKLQEMIQTTDVATILSQHASIMMFYRIANAAASINKAISPLHRNT